MKKRFFQRVVLVAMAVVTTQVAVAESWRINHDQSTGAHFASINEAMASEKVQDGDMLYLDAGCVLSDAQTITKAVTVIGTGWGYSHLPYMPARIANQLYINSAAKVVGIQITNNIYPNHADIVLERCHITGIVRSQERTNSNPNLQVLSCYLANGNLDGGNSANSTGWKIYNTYIYRYVNGSDYPCITNLSDATIVNCYLRKAYHDSWLRFHVLQYVDNSLIKNNIILNTQHDQYKNWILNGSNNNISNNVFSADSTSAYVTGNYCVGSTSTSAALGTGGTWLKLGEDSPGKGFGENGIDCGPGAEGSLYPFVENGMPQYVHYPATMAVPTRPTDDKVSVKLQIVNQDK